MYKNDLIVNEMIERMMSEKEEAVSILLEENKRLKKECTKYKKKYNRVVHSRSWKIGAPLRKIKFNKKKENSRLETRCKEHYLCDDSYNSYEENIDFSKYNTEIKTIALYLPAFHQCAHNDKWWGEGFTEWDNVKRGSKLFEGHYQPRVPHNDFGYYDLSYVDTIKKQVKLAKQHGIYGFAIYYYWFSGERILEKPLDLILDNKDIDFPFMIVWANENWTRRWDGKTKDVLIEQKYTEGDPYNFINDLKPILLDERYIRVDGKPVIAIYEPASIPNLRETVGIWRKEARKQGIGEINIWVRDSEDETEEYKQLFDGKYEFPPRKHCFFDGIKGPEGCTVFDLCAAINEHRKQAIINDAEWTICKGSMLSWDNSSRRKNSAHIWGKYCLENFYIWNRYNIAYLRRCFNEENRFIFINAWNEWGEGTYLEPDELTGYANINTLSKAIFGLPLYDNEIVNGKMLLGCGIDEEERSALNNVFSNESASIAVQAHVFYPELIHEIINASNNIPYSFDLYLTTVDELYAEYIYEYSTRNSNAKNIFVELVENKGRDVIPFINQIASVYEQYDYICHIHTKKSKYDINGDVWRKYLYENLLGSEQVVEQILKTFIQYDKIGIICPENIDLIKNNIEWGGDKEIAETLLSDIGITNLELDKIPDFPAGNMFWAKTKAIDILFSYDFNNMVPEEKNQRDGTVMHAIERLWIYIAKSNGYSAIRTRSLLDSRPLL